LNGFFELTKQRKMNIPGTWNVNGFYKTGSLITVAREITKGWH
jgi:hypothetical protein